MSKVQSRMFEVRCPKSEALDPTLNSHGATYVGCRSSVIGRRSSVIGRCCALLALVVLLAIALVGCATTRQYSPDLVLAWVNGEAVTVQNVEEAFTQSHKGAGVLLGGSRLVRQFLEKVIDKRLLLQEARRIGLDQDPEIEQAIEKVKAKRAADEFYRDEIKNKVAISEEAIVAAHQRMGHRFQARRILVESRAEAEKALARVKAGEDFGEVAIQVSEHPTARKGGYLGIVQWGRLDPLLEERLWSLETGQVTEPFETEKGWNLLYAIERVSVEPPELGKAKPRVRAILGRRESKRHSDSLSRELASRWNARIDNQALIEVLEARDMQGLSPDVVLAEAAEEKITLGQFFQRVNLEKVRQLPDPMALRAMRALLEDEIFKILLRKEALARGYGEKPEIQRQLNRLRSNLAVDLVLKRVVFAKLEVSDEDAEAYYRAHPLEFTEPEAIKVSVIVLESEEEAKAVMGELGSGQDFAALARKASKDRASAQVGGEIGWIKKGRVSPDLEKMAFSLREGEVGLAKTGTGSYVIRVEEKKEPRRKSFSEVRQRALQSTLREKSQQTLKEWVTRLREASVIDIDDEAISRAVTSYEESFRQKAGMSQ